jgi:hypothetical protein
MRVKGYFSPDILYQVSPQVLRTRAADLIGRRNRNEVQARGEVRYCLTGVGIGVEFVGISPEYVQAIEEEVAGTPIIG